jgi:hypothetical protein
VDDRSAGVPDLILERYRLRELPPAVTAEIERRLPHDESLASRLGALERSDEEIARSYPSDRMADDIRQRLGRRPVSQRTTRITATRWAIPAAVAAAAAMILVRSTGWPLVPGALSPGVEDRAKGSRASLVIYRNTNAGTETLGDNDGARAGDLIRIGYRVADSRYGAIVSVDGKGVVTPHLPVDGAQAVRLESGRQVLLDRAFELDDAPRMERFYFITGDGPFDLAPVVDSVRRAAADGTTSASLVLPDHLDHVVVTLRKDSRP